MGESESLKLLTNPLNYKLENVKCEGNEAECVCY